MTTNFPGALDNFTNPAGSEKLGAGSRKHSEQHGDVNDAVEAIETRIGITGSSDTASLTNQLATHAASTTAHGISAFGATLVDDSSASAARATLGLGGAAILSVGTTAGTVAAGDDARLAAETAATIGSLISSATAKTTPVDADAIGLADSEASNVLKKFSWSALKTALQSVFATLSGKSGGQTLIGGTAASETLTLKSTSHGTKGAIVLGTASEYDEANDRLGLGTLSPGAKVHAISTTEQARLGYNTSQYAGFTVDSTGILLISPTSGEIDIATSSATATLGAELLTTNPSFTSDLSGWTDSGSTWSWHASGAAAHTAGSASNLSQNVTVSNGSTYQIVVNISGRTGGSISCTLGAVGVIESGTATTFTSSFSRTAIAGVTGSVAFTITPTTDFDGRIDDVSIKLVTLGTNPIALGLLQAGLSSSEIRASRVNNNVSFGKGSGRSQTTAGYDTHFGANAGYSCTTGSYNSNFGANAGYSGTTGNYNSNFGQGAGFSCTSGGSNSNIGYNAGYYCTTGKFNTCAGGYSAHNVTTGSNNTCAGYGSGFGITSGNSNITLGYNAGRYLADGSTSLSTPSNGAYIGTSTKASADGVTAESVFGYNAVGLGSNTVAIGDLNVTRTGMRGSVEILASSSTTASQIQGSLSASWVDSTHATRKARLVISAYDTAAREAIRLEGSGTAPLIGFYGATAVAKPTALTATVAAAPAGGTGTAAGAWDTAGNRDLAIATINNLKTRVDQLESKLQALGLLT